jgi:hypothetical protein
MQALWNFFRFEIFMAQDVLIALYFIGAVICPFVLWALRGALYRKFAFFKETENKVRTHRYAGYVYALFFIAFVFAEIVWRMMFEAMVAYFQMHDYLKTIAENMPN